MNLNISIPKVIIQTGFSEINTSKNKNKIITENPEYTYKYYNNTDCINFINKNFSYNVVKAFNKLKPGAFKADLFRYCYLFINGGVYIDLDICPEKPLNEIIIKDTHFVSCLEDRPNRNINGIYQGFIASVKNLEFYKIAINKIVINTEIEYYPKNISSDIWINILSITGPVLLYNSMNFIKRPCLGINNVKNIIIYLYKFNEDIFNLNKERILTNRVYFTRCNDYAALYKKKDIYN